MPNPDKSALILAYQKLITSKKISIDIRQKEILKQLDLLTQQLVTFSQRKRGFVTKFLFNRSSRDRRPKGIYIYGDVGRGKSLLMDLFFDNLPKEVYGKRYHFHAFMKEMHEKINKARSSGKTNVIPHIAEKLSSKLDVVCFDEMQVNDIADAMIIGRLFENMFLNGVTMVVTSNRHPDELYKDGLQRQRFIPFIDMFKENMETLELIGIKDYRLEHLKSLKKTFYTPLGKNADKFIDMAYKDLTSSSGINDKAKINLKSRTIKVPKSHMGVALFSFNDLCDKPLGSEDYIEIARQFHTIILKDIPKLKKQDYNQAIRLIHFIDALYEHKTKLICSSTAEIKNIYLEGERSFEFQRTASRLVEMQSEKYMSEPHKG